ncbi:MAG: HlyD family secretion protein [Phenylobacterium sp.]|uniref:HlyD family secretion protein n=1 Tax=Phenylobacterium sp. TaxID=1871053 RepID=UPI001A441BB9|nr:HlyD family secretion protein [Phenylobacterium sp.]MBL8556389.1 HlyD family secretion protein [Phenylobacterium sp.]
MTENQDATAPDAGGRRPGGFRRRWIIMIAGPVAVLAVLAYFLLTSGRSETTDDAYVQIAKTPVAPSISGRVIEIYVKENQSVKRGQVLFRLDQRDVKAGLDLAEAQLSGAQLAVRQARAAYERETANIAAARENLRFADRELSRQRQLNTAGAVSGQAVDQAAHAANQARDQLAVAQRQAAQALAALGGDPDIGDRAPSVMQARAQVERAQLNAGYATVIAPADGVVARVDQLPVGAYLNASQTAFWLLSGQAWVEANFKENQIGHMHVGQPVEIDIDAYPGGVLKGHVASFPPGTGAAFSALPAQNATGNWVKVTQRLPVRIEFDRPPPDRAARAGLSATVKVDLRGGPRQAP